MRIPQTDTFVKTDGAIESQGFNIVFNAKMAAILSDGYGNKISAVIRELSTNAKDSHRDAKNENAPFDVHLPTNVEPYFYIRDYGTGMSHELVTKVYTTYGASNKEDSNDFVGCLGLGSKTPFCYNSKTAIVTSWHNGIERTYQMYQNMSGMPTIDLIGETKSNEPNGVKVQFPVSIRDLYSFEEEAQGIYQFFDVTPRFIGKQIKVEKPVYSFSGDRWGLSKYGETKIIMGNVAYPIDTHSISGNTPQEDFVLSGGFHIYVNIGDVDIQPFREGLSYNPTTKAHVLNRVRQIIKDSTTIALKDISSCKSLWQARCKANQLGGTIGELISSIPSDSLKWNDVPLGLNFVGNLVCTMDDYKDVSLNAVQGYSYKKSKHIRDKSVIVPEGKIYINDLKTGHIGRLLLFVTGKNETIYYVNSQSIVELERFKEFLGVIDEDIVYTSSLPQVPSTASSRGSGTNRFTRIVKLKLQNSYRVTRNWENVSVNLTDGGLYVPFHKYSIVDSGFDIASTQRLISKLSEFIKIPDVYGIKKADIPSLGNNWTNFYEWAKDQYTLLCIKYPDYDQVLQYDKEIDLVDGYKPNKNVYNYVKPHQLKPEWCESISEFVNCYKQAKTLVLNLDLYKKLEYIRNVLGISKSKTKVKELGLVDMLNKIYKDHPILSCVGYDKNVFIESCIVDYISLKEKENVSV